MIGLLIVKDNKCVISFNCAKKESFGIIPTCLFNCGFYNSRTITVISIFVKYTLSADDKALGRAL
jgi:hypothetical protein